jgi:tetratricopeptide (TPR) repeat protein
MKAKKPRKPRNDKFRRGVITGSEIEDDVKPIDAGFPRSGSKLLSTGVLVIFVVSFGLLTITSFQQKSPTVDEPVHLLSGYASLKWGDFRANPEHPPLAKALAAIPLLFFDIKDPRPSVPEWDLIPAKGPTELRTVSAAAQMLFVDNDAEKLFFYAKLMMIALAILLGLFVYKWSKEVFGLGGAVVALFIYALDPNILAHAQLVHSDLPFTAFFFIGSYYFCRILSCLNIPNLIFAAVFFGLAAITKFAYAAMFLVWAILGLVKVCSAQPLVVNFGKVNPIYSKSGKTKLLAFVFASVLITAYVFIWAGYGFGFHAIPGGKIRLPIEQETSQLAHLQTLASFITQYRLFPEAWLYGQLYVFNRLSRTAYLFGHISGGSWLYFPVAFAVKTPVTTVILVFAVPALLVFSRRWREASLLLLPAAAYFSLAVCSGINIGLRHILPVYPFLFVLCGGVAVWLWETRRLTLRGGLVILAAWHFLSAVRIFPDYLAFFNELAGGARNGHKILLDSNLDWGQDLKGLKRWMDSKGVRKIQFLYFGFHDARAPRYYGIDAIYLPGSWVVDADIADEGLPLPSFIAISANHLYEYILPRGEKALAKSLRRTEPVASIGYSIFVYDMNAAIEQFRSRIQTDPSSSENHYHLANFLKHQGMVNEASENYRQAIRLNPAYGEAHQSLGLILARTGVLADAVEHFQKAIETGPLEIRSESQYYLGTILARQGRFAEAASYLQQVVKAEPNFPRAHYRLGVIFFAQRDIERAIAYFRNALVIDSQYADAHQGLGRALAIQGKAEEARMHFEEALRILKTNRRTERSEIAEQK